uniref:Uncharacterized protein n=1 Tax=Fagus sylvatica TaxID=28930 RepID=A0A2N9IS76_FAGSY
MGRGAGEESVVAEDIAAEVFDERFERNKERYLLVIVGRDMGRGAGEESVVAEDIAAEVFDERFERNKER